MKKNNNVTINALFIALGGFLFGFDIAVISGTTSALETVFQLSKFELGFTVAIALIGTITGTTIIGRPSDAFGRRKTLQTLAIIFTVAALGSSFSFSWPMLLVFRFIQGLTVGGISVVVPMYIAEISPAEIRGKLVAFNQFNIVTAILVAYLSNYFIARLISPDAWRVMIGVESIPGFIFFLLLINVPASPRWLVLKKQEIEAMNVFRDLGFENPEKEVLQIVQSMNEDKAKLNVNLFSKEYAFPVTCTILIAMFNQLAGINAIIYYAPRIFEMTGLAKNVALLQSIAIGGTNLLFTFLALFLIDRVGRRTLLMIGSVGMILFLSLIAIAFQQTSFNGYSVMVYLIGFMAFFAISQGAVLWVFISEIFPNQVRSKGQALGSFTHWVMAAVVSWTFPVITNSATIGGGAIFGFYAFMMLLHFFFAWKIIPETKGKTLEQIQIDMAVQRNKNINNKVIHEKQ